MECKLDISDQELAELQSLLRREIESSRNELRRTRNLEFRDQIRHHVEVLSHVLERVTRIESEMGVQA